MQKYLKKKHLPYFQNMYIVATFQQKLTSNFMENIFGGIWTK